MGREIKIAGNWVVKLSIAGRMQVRGKAVAYTTYGLSDAVEATLRTLNPTEEIHFIGLQGRVWEGWRGKNQPGSHGE